MHLSDYDIECIEKAKVIIDADLSVHFTIDDLAGKVYLGKTKLKEGFKEYYGMGLFSYLKVQRMEKAAELLVETRFTIKKIASKTGYKFTNNFNKAFSSFHGLTPGNYRKKFGSGKVCRDK